MKSNFPACHKITLAYEGGWSDHKKDPGGATMKGITLATFRRYVPGATKADLRKISAADVERIYRDGYWNPIKGDLLPAGVDLVTYDYGVNSGPSRSAKALQSVVGVRQDGKVGPNTINAVMDMVGKTVIQKLCAKRLGFVRGLKTWATFGKGWSRRIADVEAKAVAMWLRLATSTTPTRQKEILREDAAEAEAVAKQQQKGGGAAAGGGAVAGGGDVVMNGELSWIVIAVVVVAISVAVVAVVKARQNKDRARAYEAAAVAV